jgi:hypothetical protein
MRRVARNSLLPGSVVITPLAMVAAQVDRSSFRSGAGIFPELTIATTRGVSCAPDGSGDFQPHINLHLILPFQ